MSDRPDLAALEEAIRAAAADDAPGVLGALARWQAIVLAEYVGRAQAPPAPPAADALLSVPQVAEHLGVPEQYVRELIRRADLPALKVGRYHRVAPADLARWETAQRITPPPAPRRLDRRRA